MKLNKLKTVSKYFLYTLLCICIFASMTLIGMFVTGNTNVFEWTVSGRMGVIVSTVVVSFLTILNKEAL